mmetsp:Transcript_13821/g.32038  ORF Transcript_13821/g.32038 Transcript_13821/m.32038 type:complete len:106 (-) Transcript_13821:159-476(-)
MNIPGFPGPSKDFRIESFVVDESAISNALVDFPGFPGGGSVDEGPGTCWLSASREGEDGGGRSSRGERRTDLFPECPPSPAAFTVPYARTSEPPAPTDDGADVAK